MIPAITGSSGLTCNYLGFSDCSCSRRSLRSSGVSLSISSFYILRDFVRSDEKSIPLKNGCALISSTPLRPRRVSVSQINLFKISVEAEERFASGGTLKVFRQCMIFWQVMDGSSEKNGG